jgi:thiol-disulfide isomerase/thioredoxin
MPLPKGTRFFKTGEKFNLGKVTDMRGSKIDLKDNRGKITVINFWFVNCTPCRMEIPELNKLVSKYAPDSVRFIAIALDEKFALEGFLKSVPFDYKIIDNGRYLAQKYGVQSYPTHVVVNQEGKVHFHTTGLSANTVYWLDKSIKGLLGKTVTPSALQ